MGERGTGRSRACRSWVRGSVIYFMYADRYQPDRDRDWHRGRHDDIGEPRDREKDDDYYDARSSSSRPRRDRERGRDWDDSHADRAWEHDRSGWDGRDGGRDGRDGRHGYDREQNEVPLRCNTSLSFL